MRTTIGLCGVLAMLLSTPVQAQTPCTFDPGCTEPTAVIVTPDGQYLYVACGSGDITRVRLSDHTVVNTITVGYDPHHLAISPDGEHLFATNTVDGYYTTKISTATDSIECTIPGYTDPSGIAITPDGDTAIIVANWTGILQGVPVDACAASYTIGGLGAGCIDVVVTPDGKYAYATSTTNPVPWGVFKVDLKARQVVDTLPAGLGGLDITPDGALLFVTNSNWSNYVYVVSTAADSVIDSIHVGNGCEDVKVSPDGLYAYVSHYGGDSVAVLSVADRSVIAILPVGQSPRWLAISPDGIRIFVPNYNSNCITEFTRSCVWAPVAPPCVDRKADINCDTVEDVFDVIYLIDYVFSGGPPRVLCPQE